MDIYFNTLTFQILNEFLKSVNLVLRICTHRATTLNPNNKRRIHLIYVARSNTVVECIEIVSMPIGSTNCLQKSSVKILSVFPCCAVK